MKKIKNIIAREILDSRGNPTIEVDVILDNGIIGRAAIPSGASTGENEAVELRDKGRRYNGRGVRKAVSNVKTIFRGIKNVSPFKQTKIDETMIDMDGTNNKGRLGANAILAVSLAVARAASIAGRLPLYEYIKTLSNTIEKYTLPTPMMNIINGGAHADNNLDIQEFMIVPVSPKRFSEKLRIAVETLQCLKSLLKAKRLSTSVGDEGGFAPKLTSHEQAIELIISAIKKASYKPGKDIYIALDIASSEFYNGKTYTFKKTKIKAKTSKEMIEYYKKLINKYPIVAIEDALAENDWNGWETLTERIGDKIMLVGDDIFVTNKGFLKKGIERKIANAILIKLNQIGTLTETLEVIKIAKEAGYKTVISHRSGETEDTFIADLAVGTCSPFVKAGAPVRSERIAKYNQLLRIEEKLLWQKY